MQIDIGAFDLAVNVNTKVEWLEHTDDIAVLNLRSQFEKNLSMLAQNYQSMFAKSLGNAIIKHKMYFQTPDINMENMNADELDSLKDLG